MNQYVYLSIAPLPSNAYPDDHDLMLMDDDFSDIDIFDPIPLRHRRKTLLAPLTQTTSNSPSPVPLETHRSPTPETPILPSHFPYPIKLRLKQNAYPEMKQFSQFVQQMLAEQRFEQVKLTGAQV